MKIDEVLENKYKNKTYKLTRGVTGRGGEVGDIVDMAKRHYKAWDKLANDQKYKDFALSDPEGLLKAWIEKFYGSSSARINLKKAVEEYGVDTNLKGADAILRIAIGIIMKPKTRVEVEAYYDQVKDLAAKDMRGVGERMPAGKQQAEPSAAQNQGPAKQKIPTGTLKKANNGDPYEWKGAQWVNLKTGRMATKQVASELGS